MALRLTFRPVGPSLWTGAYILLLSVGESGQNDSGLYCVSLEQPGGLALISIPLGSGRGN